MTTLLDLFPDVVIDHDNKAYFQGLADRRLVLNRCVECGWWHSEPLRSICPRCRAFAIRPEPVSGDGCIYMMTRLHQGPPVPGVSYDPPLPLVVVELDEQPGLRVTGTVVGAPVDFADIGRRVRLAWPPGQVAPRLAFAFADGRP